MSNVVPFNITDNQPKEYSSADEIGILVIGLCKPCFQYRITFYTVQHLINQPYRGEQAERMYMEVEITNNEPVLTELFKCGTKRH
jgi:hypothetical protein